MKVEKTMCPIRCDVPGCGNFAKKTLTLDKNSTSKVNLCDACVREIRRVLNSGGERL